MNTTTIRRVAQRTGLVPAAATVTGNHNETALTSNLTLLSLKLGRRLGDGRSVRQESGDELLDRVAGELAKVERAHGADDRSVRRWAEVFRVEMAENRFWPSGRILNNCGARQGQRASCFVPTLYDDFLKIFDTLKIAADRHRSGGETGFDLTPLGKHGAPIETVEAAGASGPVSCLHLFDAETRVVIQGGKMRGADLASLSAHHPDVVRFIDARSSVGQRPTSNVPLAADDAFMRAIERGGHSELVGPRSGKAAASIYARQVWDRIVENVWRSGDPGLLFVDTINRANPLLRHLGPIRTTNPYGEQTLYPFEASNLGSVNLASFVSADGRSVDTDQLARTVRIAVRMLDDAIDASYYPDPQITEMARANRRLGLGVMGFADLLVALGVPYDSEESLQVIDEVGGCLRETAWQASRELAAERGPFPHWPHTGWQQPARNCAVTTIAPTGTISMVAGCSRGIEPRFAAGCNKDAYDVSPSWHVRVAARWQRYIDNTVCKTVNMPRSAEPSDISDVMLESWRSGCKGVSVYRQGSRDRNLLEARTAAADPARQSKELLRSAVTGRSAAGVR